MSTQKTPVYGLHQWAGTDPVSRTEMNENFSKLEDSLAANKPYELLYSTTTTADAGRVTLTLPQIDWDSYMQLRVIIHDAAETSKTSPAEVYVYVNSVQSSASQGCHCTLSGSRTQIAGVAYIDVAYGILVLHVNRNSAGQVRVSGHHFDSTTMGWYQSKTWEDVTSIIFDALSGQTIHSGTVLEVWGVK